MHRSVTVRSTATSRISNPVTGLRVGVQRTFPRWTGRSPLHRHQRAPHSRFLTQSAVLLQDAVGFETARVRLPLPLAEFGPEASTVVDYTTRLHPVPRSGRSGRIPVKRLSCPRNRVRYRRGLSADGALRTGHNAVRHCRPAFAVAEQRCCGCSLHSASAPHARALAGSQPYGPCPHAGRQRSRCGVGSPELAT